MTVHSRELKNLILTTIWSLESITVHYLTGALTICKESCQYIIDLTDSTWCFFEINNYAMMQQMQMHLLFEFIGKISYVK